MGPSVDVVMSASPPLSCGRRSSARSALPGPSTAWRRPRPSHRSAPPRSGCFRDPKDCSESSSLIRRRVGCPLLQVFRRMGPYPGQVSGGHSGMPADVTGALQRFRQRFGLRSVTLLGREGPPPRCVRFTLPEPVRPSHHPGWALGGIFTDWPTGRVWPRGVPRWRSLWQDGRGRSRCWG
jgi:hypothetical protein